MNSSRQRRLSENKLTEIICYSEDEVYDVVDILQNQPNHSSLKEFCLGCMISVDCARSIANLLKINKSIIKFNCIFTLQTSGNRCICSDGIVAITEALSDYNNTALTKLVISATAMNYAAILAMSRMLETNKALTNICIASCNINSDGAILIGDALKVNTTLTYLNLGFNEIGDIGVIAIADGIKDNESSSLSLLKLNRNNFGIIGARSIASMLRTNTSLTKLHISGNVMIGTDGVIAIVEALKQNKSLATLDLICVPFGDDGAGSIASLLKTKDTMKSLSVNGCNIGDAGLVSIADALRTNKSLERLHLGNNPISNYVVTTALARMIEINTTLRELHLGNHIKQMDIFVVRAVLKALQDYNDTVDVLISAPDRSDEVSISLRKIRDLGTENRKGIRIAPFNRRNIFRSLETIWMTRARDT